MTLPEHARVRPRRAPGRDRDHQQRARTRAILLRYTETESAAITAAARDAGLTPSGYMAEAARATATQTEPPSTAPWRAVLLELMDARSGPTHRRQREPSRTGPERHRGIPVWLEQVLATAKTSRPQARRSRQRGDGTRRTPPSRRPATRAVSNSSPVTSPKWRWMST